jgi:DNA-binding transcriptional LysR family regulator
MPRSPIDDMMAFLEVAREQSFTRAAAKLGVTPSALSHSMRGLEERLGLRLLSRTTRSVSLTDAGERLSRSVGPHFAQIEAEIAALSELRDRPAGTIRISCGDSVIDEIFRPVLLTFLREYPDISVELAIDNGFVDIVEQRFDAGVRLGEALSKDMIAVRIGPDWRFSVVGSSEYFAKRPPPVTPHDLTAHNCINLRLTTGRGLYAWEFEKEGRKLDVRVEGQLVFNSVLPIRDAAIDGHGLGNIPEFVARPHIERGELVEVLADWSPYWQGFHLYFPHRRQPSPAFAAFVEAVRYRAK